MEVSILSPYFPHIFPISTANFAPRAEIFGIQGELRHLPAGAQRRERREQALPALGPFLAASHWASAVNYLVAQLYT